MARKSSSTAVQEELYPAQGAREVGEQDVRERQPFDDSRIIDLESGQESPFLRGQKRVSVRRSSLPPKTAHGLKWAGAALVVAAGLGAAGASVYSYGKHSWRFRIDSSDQIEVVGAQHVSHAQIIEVMGADIGRNIFFVPLAQRRQQVEQIPWVESASVMRFVPNRLRIAIHERTPIAFARIGSHISLIDSGGNLMELAPGPKHAGVPGTPGSGVMGSKYSFPVITGMTAGEPLSTRSARMKIYNDLIAQLDSGGAHYSQDISEVDLSDPEDAKVMTADANGDVLVHLGSGNYLQRYRVYVTHVQAWRQQFEKLDSVDLRYDGQIIVNPDLGGMSRQPALTPAAAKAALAAGVKSAAIVNYEKYVTHPLPPAPVSKPLQAKSKSGTAAKKTPKPGSKTAAQHAAPKPKMKTVVAKNQPASHALTPKALAPASSSSPVNTGTAAAPHAPAKTSTPMAEPAHTTPVSSVANSSQKTTALSGSPQVAGPKPASPASTPSGLVDGGQKKPSPMIPKENSQN